MTINIISKQVNRSAVTGPKKVLDNTLKGLDRLGIQYVFNEPINEHVYNWIHDDQKAIIEAGFVGKPVVVGPNTAVLPRDLPRLRKKLHKASIYIHPSQWAKEVWRYLGYQETSLDFWPAGIDLEEFDTIDRTDAKKVLLYFKERELKLLDYAQDILKRLGLSYDLIHYGFYKEADYKNALKECQFGVWIGRQESQGIGLQEALATGLPLIVMDATSLFDTVPTQTNKYYGYTFPKKLQNIKVTTVPYFDDRCGIIIDDINHLEVAIQRMLNNAQNYKPRQYIEETLSLEQSVKKLIGFFEDMKIDDTQHKANYQNISKILFYSNLIIQKWAWKWIWQKVSK